MKQFGICGLILLLVAGCVKEDETPQTDAGYDYYPYRAGLYWIYQVDSTYHDQPDPDVEGVHKTVSYQVKALFAETIEDNEGREAMRIERYKRPDSTAQWHISDVWMAVKTKRRVEKVEENVRFVRLAFPVGNFETWDGNALNYRDSRIYSYDSIGQPLSVEGVNFMHGVTVIQDEEMNAVRRVKKYEKYARGVGLVKKYVKDLDTRIDYISNPTEENIRKGIEYSYKILEYGME